MYASACGIVCTGVCLCAATYSFIVSQERQKVMKLIGEQHQMEENELTFTLALEQNEAAEKLRKVR